MEGNMRDGYTDVLSTFGGNDVRPEKQNTNKIV